jgi:hypothetical protein
LQQQQQQWGGGVGQGSPAAGIAGGASGGRLASANSRGSRGWGATEAIAEEGGQDQGDDGGDTDVFEEGQEEGSEQPTSQGGRSLLCWTCQRPLASNCRPPPSPSR